MRNEDEVETMIDEQCTALEFDGISYRDGVRDALKWVLEKISDNELLTGEE